MALVAFIVSFVWCTNYDEGYKTALDNKLPMIVVIGTPGCTACAKLDKELETMDFGIRVAVKVDGNKHPDLVQKFAVKVYPTVILCDSNMNVTHYIADPFGLTGLRQILEKDKGK